MKALWVGCVALLAFATVGRAEQFSLDSGIHYAKLNLEGVNAARLDDADGAVFDIAFQIAPPHSGWRFGAGLMVGGWYEEFQSVDPNLDITDAYQSLSIIIPELRIGYHIPLGDPDGNHLFIEPSMGVGLAIGTYSSGDVYFGTFYDDNGSRTRANIAFRPKVQVGYSWDRFALGLEGSYLWTDLDFGNGIGGELTSWTAGVFFRWRF